MELIVELGEDILGLLPIYRRVFPRKVSDWLLTGTPLADKDEGCLPWCGYARESLTLWIVATAAGFLLYMFLATFCYYTYFDRSLTRHPKFLKNQVQKEISMALKQICTGALFMLPFWIPEIHGYAKIYRNVDEYGWGYLAFSVVAFIIFSDFCIYWIHRFFHHPSVYSWLHKPHHMWKIPTPFSSFAFHPLDGFGQSLPYHVFPFIFPMQAHLFVGLFFIVQVWTFMIHDNAFLTANHYINGAAHHTIHHLEFNYNYGQYFTLWDILFGTHRFPSTQKDIDMYFKKALAVNPGKKFDDEEEEKDVIHVDGKKRKSVG